MAISLNYLKPSDKDPALKALARKLGQAGAVVIAQSVDQGTPLKRAGIAYRTANLSFADSQVVQLLFKESGDVFEVKLNGKAVPVTAQTDVGAAGKEIAGRLAAGRAKFQAAMTKAPVTKVAAIRVSRTNQLKQLTEARDTLASECDTLQSELDALRAA
jgi:ribosomal protein L7/L12